MYWQYNYGRKNCDLSSHQKPRQRYGIALDLQYIYSEWLDKDDLITVHTLRLGA